MSQGVNAQSNDPPVNDVMLEGRVVNVIEEKEIVHLGEEGLYQKLEILITKGLLKNETVEIEVGDFDIVGQPEYKKGDILLINHLIDINGNSVFYITDYVRRLPLFLLFCLFVLLVTIIGKWRGFASLLGLLFSFAAIFLIIIPGIQAGKDPVLITILASFFIITLTFYTSHGLNKKTTVAIAGTLVALGIAGILSKYFVEASNLTGFASEEASFLHAARHGAINIKGLLLAGIIIGTLGVLDDITVSQAAIVQQLKEVNPKIKPGRLFSRAMAVGQDHISSMVNTLVLVYTGASLPLLLLFIDSQRSFLEVINYEIIAEEIVRTLVGSISLIAAVPITTFIATNIFSKKTKK